MVKNAILKALVEGAICELMVRSNIDNIMLADGTTTLTSKLAEMVTAINERAKTADVSTLIAAAKTEVKSEIIDGAPGAYDTLKEIADYLATHEDEYTALVTTVAGKVSQTAFDALKGTVDGLGALATKDKVSEGDLDTALAKKITDASAANHSHSNKSVLDGITAAKVTEWNGERKDYRRNLPAVQSCSR